jgi:hypothetical protein
LSRSRFPFGASLIFYNIETVAITCLTLEHASYHHFSKTTIILNLALHGFVFVVVEQLRFLVVVVVEDPVARNVAALSHPKRVVSITLCRRGLLFSRVDSSIVG